LDLVDDRRVIVGVEVVEGNVADENSVEFHVSMRNWEIDEVCLQGILVSPQESQKETGTNPVIEHNTCNALREVIHECR